MKRSDFLKWLAFTACGSVALGIAVAFSWHYDVALAASGIVILALFVIPAIVGIAIFRLALRHVDRRDKSRHSLGLAEGGTESIHRKFAAVALLMAISQQLLGYFARMTHDLLYGYLPFGDWRNFDLKLFVDDLVGAGRLIVVFAEWMIASYALYGLALLIRRISTAVRSRAGASGASAPTGAE